MDKEMTFLEHLGELRIRLFRMAIYIVLGGTAGWFTYPWVDKLLVQPAAPIFASKGIKFVFLGFTGPFFLRFQVALIVGAAYVLPLVMNELWGFISPALLPHERKWVRFVAPLAVLFFVLGLITGYLVMSPAIRWFLSYLEPGQTVMQNAQDYIVFECKCILAFGLVFQLPVVLMFLAMVGIVNSELLKSHWRYAVCALTIVAAVVTPSNDPATMLAMAVPLVILYGLSIFLVGVTERMAGRKPPPPNASMLSG